VECDAAKHVTTALDCYAEAINFCCDYIVDRGSELDIAIEPKPNEPRGNLFLPTVGHALAFIHELAHPDMVGLNPELAHETMSGLSFHHGVAQALLGRQAVPHRPQRAGARPVRPGLPLRPRGC